MEKPVFSSMAIDAIGEMMNISLGSSATAISNMLDHRVDITTPKVSVMNIDDFELGNIEPAMGVEIKYVEGLEGSNIMLLKRSDVKVIVDILMGSETPDEEFELNDLTISAVCEVMNQMMGGASTAMSDFLGYPVNISTPVSFELEDTEHFKEEHLPQNTDQIVVVRFALRIEGALESEFMNVLSVELCRHLLSGLGLDEEGEDGEAAPPPPPPPPAAAPSDSGGKLSQEEIERLMSGMAGGDSAPPPTPTPSASGPKMSQEEIERLMSGMAGGDSAPPPVQQAPPMQQQMPPVQQQMPQMQQQMPPMQQQMPQMPQQMMPMPEGGYMGYPPYYPPYPYPYPPQAPAIQPKVIETKPVEMKQIDVEAVLGQEQAQNLDLIMGVPLQVTVEIGRTRRKVQDILEFAKGSLVILDKLAGDQVDLFVNGKCIARGDVVVIEDNFGVRITEIVQKPTFDSD